MIINVDHKDGLVLIGFSSPKIKADYKAEQVWFEMTPQEAGDIALLLMEHAGEVNTEAYNNPLPESLTDAGEMAIYTDNPDVKASGSFADGLRALLGPLGDD